MGYWYGFLLCLTCSFCLRDILLLLIAIMGYIALLKETLACMSLRHRLSAACTHLVVWSSLCLCNNYYANAYATHILHCCPLTRVTGCSWCKQFDVFYSCLYLEAVLCLLPRETVNGIIALFVQHTHLWPYPGIILLSWSKKITICCYWYICY